VDFSSLDGVLAILILVLPGGLGLRFKDWIWSGSARTPFEEIFGAAAASFGALLMLEVSAGVIGIGVANLDVGDYLVNDLVDVTDGLVGESLWLRYLAFFVLAFLLPSFLAYLRRREFFFRRTSAYSVYHDGFEALFEETIHELARKDSSWEVADGRKHAVRVDTVDGHSFVGYIRWRSTPPKPTAVNLSSVTKVSANGTTDVIDGVVWFEPASISRIWILKPDEPGANQASGRVA
jgi:Family of unknown function (DUF6338)